MANHSPKIRTCSRCVLDTTAPDITFDNSGVCNYCRLYEQRIGPGESVPLVERQLNLEKIVAKIKERGRNNEYDCVLGLSGGVDSSYMAYLAKTLGLRPLITHFDNGWNSELAVKNIESVITQLGYDLHTHVINWDEFRDLQLAYLNASVIDVEVPTDHLIKATLYKVAKDWGIKYILDGLNWSTEFIMPKGWNFSKTDSVNLENIHKQFGKLKLRHYPRLSYFKRYYYEKIYRLKNVYLLNYLPYNQSATKKTLVKELGWREYSVKHAESIFTKFYQLYILPEKFNVDKRKAHLSNLICSAQITRDEAIEKLKMPHYSSTKELERDLDYVVKKLGISLDDFDRIMKAKPIPHENYGVFQYNMLHAAVEKLRKTAVRIARTRTR